MYGAEYETVLSNVDPAAPDFATTDDAENSSVEGRFDEGRLLIWITRTYFNV